MIQAVVFQKLTATLALCMCNELNIEG